MDKLIPGLVLMALALPAAAQPPPGQQAQPGCGPRVIVEYTDDDPDYFIIKNRSPEGWTLAMLAIDLGQAAGALVFDTDEGGPGVGGASPFYGNDASGVRLAGVIPAQDGGRTLGLRFEDFAAGRDYSFSVDLDAIPNGAGRTWVLPSDVRGAHVIATFEDPGGRSDRIDAIFDARAEADSGAGGCV